MDKMRGFSGFGLGLLAWEVHVVDTLTCYTSRHLLKQSVLFNDRWLTQHSLYSHSKEWIQDYWIQMTNFGVELSEQFQMNPFHFVL